MTRKTWSNWYSEIELWRVRFDLQALISSWTQTLRKKTTRFNYYLKSKTKNKQKISLNVNLKKKWGNHQRKSQLQHDQQLSDGLYQEGPIKKGQAYHHSDSVFRDFQIVKFYKVNLYPCREEHQLCSNCYSPWRIDPKINCLLLQTLIATEIRHWVSKLISVKEFVWPG